MDIAAGSTGSSASSSVTMTTTNASDLLLAANMVQTLTTGPGAGFTSRLLTQPDGDIAEDRMVTTAGSYTATATVSPAGQWIMQMVAFRTASTGPDTQPPTAPANLTATAASGTQINLGWTASTDNVGVTAYLVERCQGSGCSSFAQVGTSPVATYSDNGVTSATSYSYRVRATDAASNMSGYSNTASATTPAPDTLPPTVPANLTVTAISGSQINLSWTASTDNVGVTGYLIEKCQGAGCSNFSRILTVPTTTFSDTGLLPNTSYTYRVKATDAAGNFSDYSNLATTSTLATVSGLVAVYAFNEGSGTAVGDVSGNGNNGTLANATWTAAGKYGGGLIFNGTNAIVNIPDSASLHLTSAMTLEAWVNPFAVTSKWRDVIYKGNESYYLEATSDASSEPAGGGTFGTADVQAFGTVAPPVNTWTHLAVTYDSTTLRFYVNGVQTGSLAQTGTILSSTSQLQIGGDSLFPQQFFAGTIDEVRIYNVALTTAQIQSDMSTPIVVGPTPVVTLSSNNTAFGNETTGSTSAAQSVTRPTRVPPLRASHPLQPPAPIAETLPRRTTA